MLKAKRVFAIEYFNDYTDEKGIVETIPTSRVLEGEIVEEFEDGTVEVWFDDGSFAIVELENITYI